MTAWPDPFADELIAAVTTFAREQSRRAINELREVDVTPATLYAPPADTHQVLRFPDDVAPLVDATNAT